MHSCELHVTDEWMRHYRTALKKLLQQFSHIPQMATVGPQIEEVSVRVCVCVCVCVRKLFSPSRTSVVLHHSLCALCLYRC